MRFGMIKKIGFEPEKVMVVGVLSSCRGWILTGGLPFVP